jgi:hypothetical protein
VSKRSAIKSVGRFGVRVERSRVEDIALLRGSSPDQYVIVQVRLAVSIETVCEGDHALPSRRVFTIITVASIPHH